MHRKRKALDERERYEKVMSLPPNAMLSIAETSQLLGCSIRQIYNMMDDRRLRYEPPTPRRPHRRIRGVHVKEAYLTTT